MKETIQPKNSMTTETTTRTLYKFNELSEKSQQKALEDHASFTMETNDYSFHYVHEDAKRIGLKIISLDDHRSNRGRFITNATACADAIMKEHGESCETFKEAEAFRKAWNKLEDSYNHDDDMPCGVQCELEELEETFLHDLLEEYRLMLNREQEFRLSREQLIENIKANEYEYTEDGKLA